MKDITLKKKLNKSGWRVIDTRNSRRWTVEKVWIREPITRTHYMMYDHILKYRTWVDIPAWDPTRIVSRLNRDLKAFQERIRALEKECGIDILTGWSERSRPCPKGYFNPRKRN